MGKRLFAAQGKQPLRMGSKKYITREVDVINHYDRSVGVRMLQKLQTT